MRIKLFFIICFISISLHADIITIQQKNQLPNDPRELYIDMVKKCVANTIYQDGGIGFLSSGASHLEYNEYLRENGRDWPDIAHTMIGMKRLNNLHECLKKVIERNIPGDCIETGVWRGGATILMRAILKAYDIKDKKVWVADSFNGLPPPNPSLYPVETNLNLHLYKELVVSLDVVQENFKRYGLLDDQVIFVKGLFSQTLPTAPIEKLAILRLDGDMYESTMDALINLYPKLAIGGFIIIDDYQIPACVQAVQDYRKFFNIEDPIIPIDGFGIYWEKTK